MKANVRINSLAEIAQSRAAGTLAAEVLAMILPM
jgi:methionyl aminopeptidase